MGYEECYGNFGSFNYLPSVAQTLNCESTLRNPRPDSLVQWPLSEECLFMDIIVTLLHPRNMTTLYPQVVVPLEQFFMVSNAAALTMALR